MCALAAFLSTGCLGNNRSGEPQEGSENDELQEGNFNPIGLSAINRGGTNETMTVEITQDGKEVYSGKLEIGANNDTIESAIEVDKVIQENGEYMVRAQVNGMNETQNIAVSHSTVRVVVEFDNETIRIVTEILTR